MNSQKSNWLHTTEKGHGKEGCSATTKKKIQQNVLLTAQGNTQTHRVVRSKQMQQSGEWLYTRKERRDLAISATAEQQGAELWSKLPRTFIPMILFCQPTTRIHSWKTVTYSSVTKNQTTSNWLRVSKGQLHIYFSQGLVTTQNMGIRRKGSWADEKKKYLSAFSWLPSNQT